MSRLLFEALTNLQTDSDRLRFQSQFPLAAVISTAFCRNLTAKQGSLIPRVFSKSQRTSSTVSIEYVLAGFCYRLHIFLFFTHGSADLVADPEVKSTLLIHRVVDARKFRKLRPVVFEGVIQETIIRAVRTWRFMFSLWTSQTKFTGTKVLLTQTRDLYLKGDLYLESLRPHPLQDVATSHRIIFTYLLSQINLL